MRASRKVSPSGSKSLSLRPLSSPSLGKLQPRPSCRLAPLRRGGTPSPSTCGDQVRQAHAWSCSRLHTAHRPSPHMDTARPNGRCKQTQDGGPVMRYALGPGHLGATAPSACVTGSARASGHGSASFSSSAQWAPRRERSRPISTHLLSFALKDPADPSGVGRAPGLDAAVPAPAVTQPLLPARACPAGRGRGTRLPVLPGRHPRVWTWPGEPAKADRTHWGLRAPLPAPPEGVRPLLGNSQSEVSHLQLVGSYFLRVPDQTQPRDLG